ncbi:MAG TPA: hypothetical protein VIG49_07280 [Acetobacteraceae bacterium]|jgi:hypothetical protein
MTETTSSAGFREVRGTFPRSDAMQDAVERLSLAGFDRADMTLPTNEDLPAADTESDARQLRTLGSSTAASVAALAAAGVTVATGGAAAPAVVAAVLAGGAAGGAVYKAQDAANDSEQHSRTERAREGHLVLAVRTPTEAKQAQAADILSAAGAENIERLN